MNKQFRRKSDTFEKTVGHLDRLQKMLEVDAGSLSGFRYVRANGEPS